MFDEARQFLAEKSSLVVKRGSPSLRAVSGMNALLAAIPGQEGLQASADLLWLRPPHMVVEHLGALIRGQGMDVHHNLAFSERAGKALVFRWGRAASQM